MKVLSVPQPWAMLLSRGVARFDVRDTATTHRGTVAIHASAIIDQEAVARLQSDTEFAARLASEGLHSEDDIHALPRRAIVGVAVIADVWNLESLEEVATEDDAMLLGDVAENAVFWELAEAVAIEPIADAEEDAPAAENADRDDLADDETEGDDADTIEERDVVHVDAELSAEAAEQVRAAVIAAGARFDDDDLVFWPVHPSPTLAELIGDDAVGDREITRRVWAYVVEQDLQDPEDHSYVYLDDALRTALAIDEDGMPTIDFTDRVVAQMVRPR